MLVALTGPTARAQALSTSTLNVVYLESNIGSIPNSNSIYGFSNDGTGILTPLPGSPYLTGGTGVYDPGGAATEFDADQEIIIRPPYRNLLDLLAVNGDSNTVASFTINSDGSLTAVTDSPFASNGQNPVSVGLGFDLLAAHLSWLAVLNKNEDPNQNRNGAAPNLSMFRLNEFGKIQFIAASTQNLAADSSPSQALEFSGSGAPNLYLDTLMGSSPGITDYLINGNTGYITQQNFAGPPVAGALVLGMSANPLGLLSHTDRYIYVGLPSLSEVGVYEISGGGFRGGGPIYFQRAVANPGLAVCWTAVNAAGTYLYTAESNSGTVTVYSLAHAGSPVGVQHFALATTAGVTTPAPANLAFDPPGGFLYVLDNLNSVLHVLTVNSSTGLVSEPNPPTVLGSPPGEEALGLATAQL